ncbi:MAG: hypothetical protein AAF718_14500 [Pseudomonadota bacterium]
MIWTILLGIAAGWGAAGIEPQLRPLLEKYLPAPAPTPVEMRAITLSLCLLIAAIVAVLTGGGGVIWLSIGFVLGVLGPRLYGKFRAMSAPDYD